MQTTGITSFVEELLALDRENPTYMVNDIFVGEDYIVGLCNEGVAKVLTSRSPSANKELVSLAVELFQNIAEHRKEKIKTHSRDTFEADVIDCILL